MSRATHTGYTDHAAGKIGGFHAAIRDEVVRTVASKDVVVVGMAMNPHVRKARNALEGAGIPFTYLEYGGYMSKWKERLAIKMWSGWPTFPQVFVKGKLVGGNSDLAKAIEDGSLKTMLDAPRETP